MPTCRKCRREYAAGHRFCPVDGAPLSAAADDPLIGSWLAGEFRLCEVAGRGASGTVYRAWQASMERFVAVKVLHQDLVWASPESVRRMGREARTVARLSHPNIVTVITAGTTDDSAPFLAMEYVEGDSLERVLEGGALPVERASAIARQVVDALAETHAAGVVHRDLKPANLLLAQRRCADDFVKILDFGIAKRMPDESGESVESQLTRAGTVCGTPHYIAPEQASGEPVDHRADIYSVGVLLYRMVTGQVPFDGSGMAVLLAHTSQTPVPPHEINPRASQALSTVIMRCMQKRPEDRYQSAEELARALDSLAGANGGIGAHAASTVDIRPSAIRSARGRARLGSGLVLATLVALALVSAGITPGSARRGEANAASEARELARNARSAEARLDPTGALGRGDELLRSAGDGTWPRRVVVVSEGGYSLRVLMPERALVDVEYEILLDVWDPDGEPLATSELIVTIDDPTGHSRGVAAKPTAEPGRYRFRRSFAAPGPHTICVFPPSGGASIRVFYDVIAPGADAQRDS